LTGGGLAQTLRGPAKGAARSRPLANQESRNTVVPNKKSAEKAARQAEKRRLHNRAQRSTLRTELRKTREAIATGDAAVVAPQLSVAQSKLGKAAKVNLIKKKTASRRTSRLMKSAHRAAKAAQPAG
jgi:small subunit ribosomal protein S20